MQKHDSGDAPVATYADIKSILGEIGSVKLLAILSSRPTISKKHRYGFPAIATFSAQLNRSKVMRQTS